MVTISIPKPSLATRLTQYLWVLSALLTPVPCLELLQPRDFASLPPASDSYYKPAILVMHSLGSLGSALGSFLILMLPLLFFLSFLFLSHTPIPITQMSMLAMFSLPLSHTYLNFSRCLWLYSSSHL